MKIKDKRTKYTMNTFVRDGEGKEYRGRCPIDRNVLRADDTCWKCLHNLRRSHDSSRPSFTIECEINAEAN